MTREEIDFLLANRINFDSVKLGFTRNIPFDVLGNYEAIYRKYVDPGYVLTYWCGSCVFDMMERLIYHCEKDREFSMAYKGLEETILIKGDQVPQPEKKKRGRPKK